MPTTTDYQVGQQPCQSLHRKREANGYGEWANVHCCYKCDLTVSYCENCCRDHHEGGYEACKPNYPDIPDSSPVTPMDPGEVLARAAAFDPTQHRVTAIPTLYHGYRFRSRCEARWAVFTFGLQSAVSILLLVGPPDFREYRAIHDGGDMWTFCLDTEYHGTDDENRFWSCGDCVHMYSTKYQNAVYASRSERFF